MHLPLLLNTAKALTVRGSRRAALLLLAVLLMPYAAATAQVLPDSTRAPSDSTFARTDSTGMLMDNVRSAFGPSSPPRAPEAPPRAFPDEVRGRVVAAVLPIRSNALDATALLAQLPASFVYRFDTPGWPDGWSPYGLNPNRVALSVGSLPFDDLLTGRPRFDLLPLDFLDTLRVDGAAGDGALLVQTALRPFAVTEPLTEIRYRSGDDALQAIAVSHAQARRVRFFGVPASLNLLAGYIGRASEGEYPGSRLRRERRLLFRARYARPLWTLELMNLHNRRYIGAQGGVTSFDPYDRFEAVVASDAARRRTIRNDLQATLRADLMGAPASLSVYWTSQVQRYTSGGGLLSRSDTLRREADRLGFAAARPVSLWGRGALLEVGGWRTGSKVGSDAARLFASARDTLRLLGAAGPAQVGIHWADQGVYPSASLLLRKPFDKSVAEIEASFTGVPPSAFVENGFGRFVKPAPDAGIGREALLRLQASRTAGPFTLTVGGFAQHTSGGTDVFVTSVDTARVVAEINAQTRYGAYSVVTWREAARRGFYARLDGTTSRTGSSNTMFQERLARAVPSVFGSARAGVRFVIFQGDLVVDGYALGRGWGAFGGRTLNPATGLLAVRSLGATEVPAYGTLDLGAEARVRTATFFLTWENVLASSTGGGLYRGVTVVPIYPLPERRFRFGVYWPILG